MLQSIATQMKWMCTHTHTHTHLNISPAEVVFSETLGHHRAKLEDL